MKTRFSSLVSVKKDSMQKSERVVKKANQNLQNAQEALSESLQQLQEIAPPQEGVISDFLANRTLLDAQRTLIKHNEEWVAYARQELFNAQEELKHAMIEYEKFKYLEVEEIKKILDARKLQERKDLDEVALMTYEKKRVDKEAS